MIALPLLYSKPGTVVGSGAGWQRSYFDLGATRYYPYSSNAYSLTGLSLRWSRPARSVRTGDIDSDGDLEVVTTDGSSLRVYDGRGNELWEVPTSADVHLLGDVTGEGAPEILLGYRHRDNNLKIDVYSGSGDLLKTLNRGASGYDSAIAPRHVEGDRIFATVDAGYSLTPRGLCVLSYSSGRELLCYQIGPVTYVMPIGDIDGDGKLEVALGAGTNRNGASGNGTTDEDLYSVLVREDGTNVYTKKIADWGSETHGYLWHMLADLNSDGKPEIVVFESHDPVYYQGTDRVHLASEEGGCLATFVGPVNGSVWYASAADINGDGKLEIIASAANEERIYVLDDSLSLLSSSAAGEGRVLAVNDFEGGGDLEMIVFQSSTKKIRVLKNDFREVASYVLADCDGGDWYGHGDVVIVSDLDGDGRNELIVLDGKGTMYVLEGTGPP